MLRVGVLALQGGVIEHVQATRSAAHRLKLNCEVSEIKTKKEVKGLDGIIIPGGESTTLQKLLEREAMFDDVKRVPAVFGTCAGAILLAKRITDAAPGQKTLELMDFEAQRNAYGTQNESFEETIATPMGRMNAVFIRAPRITRVGKNAGILAKINGDCVACEQKTGTTFYLATTFHPELSEARDALFHERFLKETSALI